MDAQNLETHKRVLGIIYVVTASFTVIIALFIRAIMGIIFGFAFEDADPDERRVGEFVMAITSFVPAILIIFSAIPTFIAGLGLLLRQAWATTFSLVIGILKLLSFPIGTAIGIYAIWIYSEDQKLKRAGIIK